MFQKRSFLLAICIFAYAQSGIAADFVSSYGMVKNVANYSTMPGWNPNSPYNVGTPHAVYVMGPDLSSSDCQGAVESVIESYCSGINYCQDIQFSDARPAMLVTLSRLPGHSFATACAGYLDEAFNKYVDEHSSKLSTTQPVAFPGVKYVSTSEPKKKTNWMTEYAERSAELENLQAQNGAGSEGLYSTNMPATFADLDFATRQQILAAGYEPYKDKSAYQKIKVEDYETYKLRKDEEIERLNNEDTSQRQEEERPRQEENRHQEESHSKEAQNQTEQQYYNVHIFVWDDSLYSEKPVANKSWAKSVFTDRDFWWHRNCSDYQVRFLSSISNRAPINKGGRESLGHKSTTDYYIDLVDRPKFFPGMIIRQENATRRLYEMSGTMQQLQKKLESFANAVKSADSKSQECGNLTVYLVKERYEADGTEWLDFLSDGIKLQQ